MGFDFKKWRKKHLLSYPQAAEVLGYSRVALINYECHGTPQPKVLRLACSYVDERPELLPTVRRFSRSGAWPTKDTPKPDAGDA